MSNRGKFIAVVMLLASLMVLLGYLASFLVVNDDGRVEVPFFDTTTTTTTTTTPTTEDPEVVKARQEAERLALEKHIRENTIYIAPGTRVFKDTEISEEVLLAEKKMALYSVGFDDGLYQVKRSYYDDDILGYVTEGSAHTTLVDFIQMPEPDCDYEYYRSIPNYPENPRVKVRGIYLTQFTFSNEMFDTLLDVIDATNINTMVIDVKNDSEELLFYSDTAARLNPEANEYAVMTKEEARALIEKAKQHGVYLIARIVTFKSPIYAKTHPDSVITYASSGQPFTEDGWLLWNSPADKDFWEYNVGIAEEAADMGFNEIQFDYVRFPTVPFGVDFNYMGLGENSKTHAVQSFLKFAIERLRQKHVYVAADLFGWAATAVDDVDIGQHWEALVNVVDYVCPMVYPSHYGPGNFGIDWPDTQPYATVYASVSDCIERNSNVVEPSILRPWIQYFTASYLGEPGVQYIYYGREQVQAQIQALSDLGVDEYILWNPTNDYRIDVLE